MKLSKRLEAVISLVPPGSQVLDVGCDHAYTAIELVRRGIAPGAVASDVREGPLLRAKAHIEEAGLSDRIGMILSDGVPEEWQRSMPSGYAVCVITAGMGGMLIRDIFLNAPGREKIRYWVASPQRDADAVRRIFTGNGFEISDELFVEEEGKYYPVIRFEQTGRVTSLSDAEALYGPLLLSRRDPVLLKYLAKKHAHLTEVLSALPPGQEARRAELLLEAEEIRRLL